MRVTPINSTRESSRECFDVQMIHGQASPASCRNCIIALHKLQRAENYFCILYENYWKTFSHTIGTPLALDSMLLSSSARDHETWKTFIVLSVFDCLVFFSHTQDISCSIIFHFNGWMLRCWLCDRLISLPERCLLARSTSSISVSSSCILHWIYCVAEPRASNE